MTSLARSSSGLMSASISLISLKSRDGESNDHSAEPTLKLNQASTLSYA
jgi:hypothetical protein